MKRYFIGLGLCLLAVAAAGQGDYARVVKVDRSFADVKEDLVLAIEDRGLVINNTAHVGTMLNRTGRDLGSDKPVFQEAEVLEFCSATISRAVMEANPESIVLCPYTISIYALPGETGTTYVGYRKFPADPRVKPAADLIEGIVKAATR